MQPASRPTAGQRQAALYLHAVHPADQALLLQAIEPDQRQVLLTLLSELQALGVPPDLALLTAAQRDAVSDRSSSTSPVALSADVTAWFQQADPGAVCVVLTAESDRLIGRVLALGPWPWTQTVLGHVGVARRRLIGEVEQACADKRSRSQSVDLSKLDQAVLCALRERILSRPAVTEALSRPLTGPAVRWSSRLRTVWRSKMKERRQ